VSAPGGLQEDGGYVLLEEWFSYSDDFAAEWDESEHPRHPEGSERGGEFAPKDGSAYAGLEEAMAASLKRIEEKIRKERIEYFSALDEHGIPVLANTSHDFPGKRGTANSVTFSKDEVATMKRFANRGDLIATHNHPAGVSFSEADIALASTVGAKEMRATGMLPDAGGPVTYRAIRPKSGWPDRKKIEDAFSNSNSLVWSQYPTWKRWGVGVRSEAEANVAFSQELAARALKELDIEYVQSVKRKGAL
jgi:hypothetical protein